MGFGNQVLSYRTIHIRNFHFKGNRQAISITIFTKSNMGCGMGNASTYFTGAGYQVQGTVKTSGITRCKKSFRDSGEVHRDRPIP